MMSQDASKVLRVSWLVDAKDRTGSPKLTSYVL